MRRKILVGCGVLAVVLLSCKSASAPAGAVKLEGTNWVMVSDVPEGAKPPTFTLQADGHRVTGFTGCNKLFGQYTLENRALHFSTMGATKMACVEPGMDLEKRFLETLTHTKSFTISGETLELRDEDKVLAQFRAGPAQ